MTMKYSKTEFAVQTVSESAEMINGFSQTNMTPTDKVCFFNVVKQ